MPNIEDWSYAPALGVLGPPAVLIEARILRLCLFEDWDIGIGYVPEAQKLSVILT